MKINKKEWLLFLVLAILGVALWLKFSYPQFLYVDLSVNRTKAKAIANTYLSSRGVDPAKYLQAVVFFEDGGAERYLQKTLGFNGEAEFIRKYNYELFFWSVRSFQPGKKDEYRVTVSSKNGKVVGFEHLLEDTEARPIMEKEYCKKKIADFLASTFAVDFSDFIFHAEAVRKLDNRIDYGFSWEHKGVYIPWSKEENSGGAKLIIGGSMAGDEIVNFSKNSLEIPEKFNRFLERQLAMGRYLTSAAYLLLLLLIGWSIYLLVQRRNDIIMHISKRWYISLGVLIFFCGFISIFNNFQALLFSYNTSSSLSSYLGVFFMSAIPISLFLSLTFMLPGLTGESLREEMFPKKQQISFFHYLNSTFWCRSLTRIVMLGYLLFAVIIGLQAILFAFGQRYLGVWVERVRLVELSSAYIPFLAAIIIGMKAGLNEEIIFRLFGIGWGKRYFKNTVLAVFITSIIWGFSHSGYAVFPVWFRGIEVTVLGLVLGWVFLKYGIITVIVAHYLFDVFWGVAPYLLGRATPYLFISSIFALSIPLIIAIAAFVVNGREEERPLAWLLNKHQKFNLEVLIDFLKLHRNNLPGPDKLKEELVSHGWDVSVVELAIKGVFP